MKSPVVNFAGAELRHDRIVGADDLEGTDGRDRVRVAHRRRPLRVSLKYRLCVYTQVRL